MFCSKCGNEIRNGEINCPECGTPTTPPVSVQQPMYYTPVQNYESKCTSIGGWVGWWLLSFFLPVIGWIIAICVTKDQSVKNGIVAYIIVGVILAIFLIILAVLGIFSAAELFS
ncbi:MAG: hypothetical protein K2H90_08650 [Oscillospiraceae bacterium]|nr:hypothetical protein [Oscillospiraceae bacterium]